MLSRYIHFVRVAYLTMTDGYSRSLLSSKNPARNARTSVFACVSCQIVGPILLAIAVTGGIPGMTQTEVMASFAALLIAVVVWLNLYIERSDQLRDIWTQVTDESAEAKARRVKSVAIFRFGSLAALLIGFGALLLRVSLEHRGLLPNR